MSEEERIEYDSEKLIPIKATRAEDRNIANRRIEAQINRLEARIRQKAKQERRTEPVCRTSHGEIICGSLTESERRAINSGDSDQLQRAALLRRRAMDLSRRKTIMNKVTSFDALAKLRSGFRERNDNNG